MASAITHFVVGASLALPVARLRPAQAAFRPWVLVVSAGLFAVAPDLDAVLVGRMPYSELVGHRGLWHAPLVLILAALAAALALGALVRALPASAWGLLAMLLAAAAVSHSLLDALTDGGPGVMLLFPFSKARLFLPWRPIHVSPVRIAAFPRWAPRILSSELPFCAAGLAAGLLGSWLAGARNNRAGS
jgi:inner membrane protein